MTDAPCKGKEQIADHPMVELGRCAHEVGGATYTYEESGCPDCGATARKTVIFACGTRRRAVRPTVENCLAVKFKADWKAAQVPS